MNYSTFKKLSVQSLFFTLTMQLCFNAVAKPTKFVTKAEVIKPDELLFQGEPIELYLENKPALIVVIPKSTDPETRLQLDAEVELLNGFFPENTTPVFIYKRVSSGVIELDEYTHRYIIDVDKIDQPMIILTEGYSDTKPMLAPYSGEQSWLNELKLYFNVKNKKKFSRYLKLRNKNITTGEEGEQRKRLNSIMKNIRKTIMPSGLNSKQVKRINTAFHRRADSIVGYDRQEYYFDKPYRELIIEVKTGNAVGDGARILNNSQGRRKFSEIKTFGGDNTTYRTSYYTKNGLLKHVKEKEIRHNHDWTSHLLKHVFWQSEYTAIIYSFDHRSSTSRDLDSFQADIFTFDQNYRLIKIEGTSYNGVTLALEKPSFAFSYKHKPNGDFQLEDQIGDRVSSLLKYSLKMGKVYKIEMQGDDWKRTEITEGNNSITTNQNDEEVVRVERVFDKSGYLISANRTSDWLGDQITSFSYKK